ncbi:hypothetical protein DBR42_22635 [Pelomonas sp. HMWF004]|nr:hypothetical protein DBR42_22635 [Pelomonas sp. HMWF004]
MKAFTTALAATLLAATCLTAAAHGDAKAKHGGIVQMAADVVYELVPQPTGAALYVVDHDKPVDTAKMTGKLTVLNGTQKTEAALMPAGGNKLEATGLTVATGAKVVASITSAEGKTATVRFSVK